MVLEMGKLLEGITIVDLSHTLAGPFATMLLADLGARVIKIEPPGGDETRTWSPFVKGFSAYFSSANRGKESIVVNLKDKRGREIIYRLVEKSHVVIENYRPGVREKLGVDPDTLFKVNSELVYCSIKGFGLNNTPYRDKPAYDVLIQGMSGLMASTGEEGRPPVRVSFALFDVITGYMSSLNIVSALLAKREGRIKGPVYIEVPMYDTAIYSMVYIPVIYLMTGRKPRRMGSGHPSIVPYQAFRAGDGKYFILAAANDRLWRKACEALGRMDLAEDPRFKTNPDRVEHREELTRILQEIFDAKPRSYWIELFEKHGVPVAPVYEVDEVFKDPHVVQRKLVIEPPHPLLEKIPQLAYPVWVNNERYTSMLPPPLKGEHTVKILEELGYSRENIEKLRREGIVE